MVCNGMERYRYEERYLLTLLSAVINQKKSPIPARNVDWQAIYKMADFHRVANVAYYGLIGVEGVPKIWRDRFFERYKECVGHLMPMNQAETLIVELMEECGIDGVVLEGAEASSYYPVREMSSIEYLEILARPGAQDELAPMLEDLDFERKGKAGDRSSFYYKIPGVQMKIHEELYFSGRIMRRHFKKFLYELPLAEGYEHISEFPDEMRYIYQICRITDRYATGEIQIRDLMDYWLFCKKRSERMDWEFIERAIKGIIPSEFLVHINNLTKLWFGQCNIEQEELDTYESMESYVLTRGEEGVKVSAKMLPLVRTVADSYRRNRKKEQMKKMILWIFPGYEYMVVLYPWMEKSRFLLPLGWGYRLMRSAFRFCKNKVDLGWQHLKGKLRQKKEAWISVIKEKVRRKQ